MKQILGLDLGTNSIGWSLIKHDFNSKEGKILGMGSRIIPMSQDILGKFDSGVSISQTAERTSYRGIRRLYQKNVLRRERLHRILNILGFLPKHYAEAIDFENKIGQFKEGKEVKVNYIQNGSGKYDFLFKKSFDEMASEFAEKGKPIKIPYDWTLYYLRKKALIEKISKEELAWVILNFNQKRGYYQLRGEEETENETKQKEYCVLHIKELIDSGEKVNGNTLYNVLFTNGWIYDRQIVKVQDWQYKTKEFIVTTTLEKDGTLKKDKDGNIKRSFKAVDSEKDWIAIKTKSQQDIDLYNRKNSTVGVASFIFDKILDNPSQKIRGKLIRTIERHFYKEELEVILKVQKKYHPELSDKNLYSSCVEELYPRNEAHQNFLKEKDFVHLFVEDIIFYQRPLKSKKSSISNCQYEYRLYKDSEGVNQKQFLKVIPKSHPLFQEFRLWQFLKNLKIYQKQGTIDGKPGVNIDVTNDFLPDEKAWTDLFDFLNARKDIEQKQLLDYFVKKSVFTKSEKDNFRWNYVEDKKYPCNETKSQFISRLKKVEGVEPHVFLDKETEKSLWHIIYSISDKVEYEKALKTFALKHEISIGSFVENFKKFPPFKSEYGAYSEKAIKKLLPLMRRGKYWNEAEVPEKVRQRIDSILERLHSIGFDKKRIDGNTADDDIPKQLLQSFIEFQNANPYEGLNTYQACYAVYNRHSEASSVSQWKTTTDITNYLKGFQQHSLRNPIVEQVVLETLRVVKDIWEYYGNGQEKFFDEIHVELGRQMKNPAINRKRLTERVTENENTNQRIRELLKELMADEKVAGDVRPYSPSHQELLKIYEEGILQNPYSDYSQLSFDEIEKIRRNANPSKSEIIKYKLWLEQGYVSPYTGHPIQLSRLFTTDYQVEHIIPQSRYFDDSLSNKVICESEVNQLKGNQTAYEFLKNVNGSVVELAQGKNVNLFRLEEYEEHCNNYFKKNPAKLKKLLSEDIPEGFIERQMNDSRYISKLVKGLLSNVVRQENEIEATSKFVIPVAGAITSKLKKDWGLNDCWNEIIAPRFKRLNGISGTINFGYWDKSINAFRTMVPDEISKGFSKKRIDHRHHALDALVIACADRRHINYLNALNAENENYALRDALLVKNKNGHYTKHFLLPWANFPANAKNALDTTIISFKQNQRIINKTNNKIWKWVEKDGDLKKEMVKQNKGDSWAIRKPMHKDTVSGAVNVRVIKEVSFANGLKDWESLVDKQLKNIIKHLVNEGKNEKAITKYFKEYPYPSKEDKVSKLNVYCYTKNATATRTELTDKFTRKQLENVTDSGIKKILENHLENFVDENLKERFDLAFNPNGIDELNKNIVKLNNGKFHQPIYKVRIYEEGNKFKIGDSGNKNKMYVEAAKGTNLFFAVYWNEERQKREYETIPLNDVIAHQKWRATLPKNEQKTTPLIPLNHEKGRFLFSLSPNDLVYVPTEDELENPNVIDYEKLTKEQSLRIYKMVSSSGNQCFFIQSHVAQVIHNKVEFSALNKMEKSIDNEMIKEKCWKLKVDRLGNITKVIK